MRVLHKSWHALLDDLLLLVALFGTVGIALKFTTFFDQWVYFPAWPNICDSIFLICAVAYLVWRLSGGSRFKGNEVDRNEETSSTQTALGEN